MAVTLQDHKGDPLEITNSTIGNAATCSDASKVNGLNFTSSDKGVESQWVCGWWGSTYSWHAASKIKLSSVKGAVANDYSDSIEINEDCDLEPGYCYCFDGEKYYKSSKYLDDGIIGIHSDTYAFNTGQKGRCKEMDVAVSGFVLAYVDKIYKPGTPLTCTENGYLTEIKLQDKRDYPERIVGTFWKEEKNEIWEPETKNVKVKGRHWIKVK